MLWLAGCAQTFDATTLGVPVTMGSATGAPAEGTPFKTNAQSVHGFWGLLTLSNPSLQKALARQLIGGQQIADLRIKSRSRWTDVLLTLLTAGLVVPRTVTFEGKVVQPQ